MCKPTRGASSPLLSPAAAAVVLPATSVQADERSIEPTVIPRRQQPMPYLGKIPFTIPLLQPIFPGLQIHDITKEEPLGPPSPSSPESAAETYLVTVTRFSVADARGNSMSLIAKRAQPSIQITSSLHDRCTLLRNAESSFYLHCAPVLRERGVLVAKALSLKTPNLSVSGSSSSASSRSSTSFTLLLTDLRVSGPSSSPLLPLPPSRMYLSPAEVESALQYLARFHSVFWETELDVTSNVYQLGPAPSVPSLPSSACPSADVSSLLPFWADSVRKRVLVGVASTR